MEIPGLMRQEGKTQKEIQGFITDKSCFRPPPLQPIKLTLSTGALRRDLISMLAIISR